MQRITEGVTLEILNLDLVKNFAKFSSQLLQKFVAKPNSPYICIWMKINNVS